MSTAIAEAVGAGPIGAAAPESRSRATHRLLALSVLLPLLLLALAAIWDRVGVVRAARERVQRTADALAEQARDVFETADLALALERDRVRGMAWPAIAASRGVHDYLVALHRRLPQLQSIFLVSDKGINAASSRAFPMHPFDLSDRDYVRAAKAGERGLHVSALFRGRSVGSIAFTVSRPLLRDGRFDGVVAATLSPAYFETFYRAVAGTPGAAAALVRSDGALLVRYPLPPAGLPQRLPPDDPVLRLARHAGGGLLTLTSMFDGRTRLVAFRVLPGLPLIVSYALDRGAYLAAWYRHVAVFAAFALLTGLVLFGAGQIALRRAAQERASLRLLLAETRRRQAAEETLAQAQKMESLGRLTGGIAHDFNNLLTAILGALELAQKRVQDARATRLLAVATEAAQRGAALTAQMLAFARRQHVELRPVQVEALIRGMDGLLARTLGAPEAGDGASGTGPRVHLDLAPESPDGAASDWAILADPVQLEMAILNLVVNARDAMPLGGELSVRTRHLSAAAEEPTPLTGQDCVMIAVSDAGGGMAPEIAARAFEPFFTTKGVKGTGLGLSMVYGFARQAGGTAQIESKPGIGTTVRLFLPRVPASAAARAVPEASDAETHRGGLRVLVVDDDPAVRELACAMLAELGHATLAAEGAHAAMVLAASAGAAFDLALLDHAMPVMTGSELATELRRLRPALPILFMTGYAESEALAPWARLGVRTLRKPFRSADLAAAVAEATAGEDAEREMPQQAD